MYTYIHMYVCMYWSGQVTGSSTATHAGTISCSEDEKVSYTATQSGVIPGRGGTVTDNSGLWRRRRRRRRKVYSKLTQ